jgi:DNA repair exonuclease SbcCD nuclease subunit
MKKVSAILTSDWHIRGDRPICRTDFFLGALWKKIEFIFRLSQQYDCPILLAGDLGHRSQWPNPLIENFISLINKYEARIFAIPGQHDLPNHSLKRYKESAIGILSEDGSINLLGIEFHFPLKGLEFNLLSFPYGIPIKDLELDNYDFPDEPFVAMSHQMVVEDKPLFPDQRNFSKGRQLLKKYPEYNLILTGDNHLPFTVKHKGRLLVNPGSIMRTRADQINHKPRVYLWDADTNKVEFVYLPIEQGVISRDHIDERERKERSSEYVKKLKLGFKLGLNFEKNMEKHLSKTRTRSQVRERIWQAMEKE